MNVFIEMISIPSDEEEASAYLSKLIEARSDFAGILARDCASDASSVSKLRYLVNLGACEEMSVAEHEAYERELAYYEKASH